MKKKVWIGIILFLILIGSGTFLFFYQEEKKKEEKRLEKQEEQKILETIKNAFSSSVVVKKESKIYEKKQGKYQEIGTVYPEMKFSLTEEKITSSTKYFHIQDTNFYLPYQSVAKNLEKEEELRYENYLPFEEVTLKKDAILLKNGKKQLSFSKEITGKVYRKKENILYFSFLHQLYEVEEDAVKSRTNLDLSNATDAVPVLVYHFIYLNGESCNESICFHEDQVSSHFSYLRDSGAFTITTEELKQFIKGEIELPKKSVLITIDDGARAEKFLPFLEKYQLHATLFLITSWYDVEPFQSPFLEIASHGHDLHNPGVCPGGQGGGIKCLSEEILQNDFRLTREKLNGTTAFCFPFYEYNEYAIEQLQKGGFEMAFIGGMQKARKGINLFKIPRISLNSTTTQEEVKAIVEGE